MNVKDMNVRLTGDYEFSIGVKLSKNSYLSLWFSPVIRVVTRVYPASHPMTVGIGARATMRWKSWEKWIDRWTCGYQPLWLVAFSNGAMATVTDRHTFWPQCGFELRAFEVKNEVLFLTLIYLDEKNWKPHPSSSVYPIWSCGWGMWEPIPGGME